MGLIAVTKPGVVPTAAARAGWEEAMTVAPAGWVESTGPAMLPQQPRTAGCRICGQVARLTKEHIPPQGVGNKGQYRGYSFGDWLERTPGGFDMGKGTPGQGGIWGYTLCKECNDLTGQRYGSEFKGWAARSWKLLHQVGSMREADLNPHPQGIAFSFGEPQDGGVAPGDFIRQVLSCMCSLSGPWALTERHPTIRRIILDRERGPLPDDLRVHLGFCFGPASRIYGPQLSVDSVTGEWAWLMELTYPPMALLMVIASNHEVVSRGVDITSFTEIEPKRRLTFDVPDGVIAGFSWSPYPWDFRSSAALGYESPIPAI
ncbi:MAG: hypothetical protein ACKV2O_14600 [Acidimicrobiales bacterium]